MEQQSPLHPMPKDEAAHKPKRAIFPSPWNLLGGGEGEGAESFQSRLS